ANEVSPYCFFLRRPARDLFCDGPAIISHQRFAHRDTYRSAQAGRVLVASRNLTPGSAHDPDQCSRTRDACLSQRHHDWEIECEHGLKGPRHTRWCFQHSRKAVDLSLEEIPGCAHALHAATDLERHRDAFRSASRLRRQSWLCATSV